MADFSHLSALEVARDKTARLTLHQITVNGVSPTLILKPATEANKPYFNALLKSAGRTIRSGVISAGVIEENREEDRDLFPKFVVDGWEDMVDATGKEAKCDKETAKQFLDALPDWLFDEVRNFASNTANYADIVDLTVKAKNSQGGSSGS